MSGSAGVQEPVFRFRDAWSTESYWPDECLTAALPALEGLGWLARAPHAGDRRVVTDVLDGLLELDIDESDAFPFGLLWALRSTGCIGEVPGLDAQLLAWRAWEETDHVGDPLPFLPALSEEDGQRVTPEAFDADPDRLHEIILFQAGGEWQLAVPSWPGSPVLRGNAAEEVLAGLVAVIRAAAPEQGERWRELTAARGGRAGRPDGQL